MCLSTLNGGDPTQWKTNVVLWTCDDPLNPAAQWDPDRGNTKVPVRPTPGLVLRTHRSRGGGEGPRPPPPPPPKE